jgi:YbgC/YbaW family acyl-CoA thioester hydrolase
MHRFDKKLLSRPVEHAFREERMVRFQDVDAAGVIFYPRAFEYFHDLYVSYLARIGLPLTEALETRSFAAPIRYCEAHYFKPLRFGDQVEVALVQAHLEQTEITLGFRVTRCSDGQVAFVGQTVHTFVEPGSFSRIEAPAGLRAALSKLSQQ